MRILLIKPKPIGDSLILTPTIMAIRDAYPEAEISVLVRRGSETILTGCPAITRVFTLTSTEKSERKIGDLWHQLKVLIQLWAVKFDYVFELGDGTRARLFASLVRSRQCYSIKPSHPLPRSYQRLFTAISSFDWQACHRVEKDFYSVHEFLPLPQPVPPMVFQQDCARIWEPGRHLRNFVFLQIGSRQPANCWHREGWLEVARALLKQFQNVVISCGPIPHECEQAEWLQQQLGPQALTTNGLASWPQVAWLLYRAKLYVGPDTAAMHLAAACQCPVVALFGPSSIVRYWHPWQALYLIVSPRLRADVPLSKLSTNEIEVSDVLNTCAQLLSKPNSIKK